MDKWFLHSKTFWINLVGGLIELDSVTQVAAIIPPKWSPYLAAGIAGLNILLRSLKSEGQGGLTLSPPDPNAVSASTVSKIGMVVLAVALACTACASLPAKQVISAVHLTARQAITALDDAEYAKCQPDVTTLHCTATDAIETDAVHQDFNARIKAFYVKDQAISVLIVDWTPGAPVPADLTAAINDASKFLTDAKALVPSLAGKAQTLLEKFQELEKKWIGGTL